MSTDEVVLRKGVYRDSVTLMRISKTLSDLDGVEVAVVAMATPLNLDLARDLGFELPAADPADLLVAVRGERAEAAHAELDALLSANAPLAAASDSEQPPLTTRSAARRTEAGVVLVSVPGEHAYAEAVDAVEAGLSVMVFSDGVPVEQEIALKDLAAEKGVLVMGPDCGTAVISGVGLGFANVLRPGPVGIVAASGTGAQQLSCLLDLAGVGVSHVLGVGGRDLSPEVGGRSANRAIAMLDEDPATELIVLVSKQPPVRPAVPAKRFVEASADLTATAEHVLKELGRPVPEWPAWPAWAGRTVTGALRGIYSGGTLCAEAGGVAGTGTFVDYGDDAYTRGRPHPMIDPTLRLEALAAVAEGDVVLMDVVLGHGADPDPAASYAHAIARCPATVVVALIGSAGDPQDLHRQAAAFREAGAAVFTSNAQAARHARSLL
ncbi:FdrA family protein [Nonomuraea endophytica]|uniref:FdrA protein n=1 Tax=Nonomuraea endophytica TaxID=714136 RepID=A0A7W8AB80_9ACTN|nr:FdrA family protein [Nonomuraea endophytica]MBB5082942.1 FdrA protein [Nonomuraea endophytica]